MKIKDIISYPTWVGHRNQLIVKVETDEGIYGWCESGLSGRELDVLRLLVGGKRNREIASALDITEGTVKLHVSSILGKPGAVDRTEAVTVALQRGLIQLDR